MWQRVFPELRSFSIQIINMDIPSSTQKRELKKVQIMNIQERNLPKSPPWSPSEGKRGRRNKVILKDTVTRGSRSHFFPSSQKRGWGLISNISHEWVLNFFESDTLFISVLLSCHIWLISEVLFVFFLGILCYNFFDLWRFSFFWIFEKKNEKIFLAKNPEKTDCF